MKEIAKGVMRDLGALGGKKKEKSMPRPETVEAVA